MQISASEYFRLASSLPLWEAFQTVQQAVTNQGFRLILATEPVRARKQLQNVCFCFFFFFF